MFFTGTLQEGIAAAIQQTRSLVCFVTGSLTSLFVSCLDLYRSRGAVHVLSQHVALMTFLFHIVVIISDPVT
ncbi:hypothetical protein OFC03_30580, partial [Escherichia coli]|nr:hypothetical protein [Escherichia coli]